MKPSKPTDGTGCIVVGAIACAAFAAVALVHDDVNAAGALVAGFALLLWIGSRRI